MKLFKIVSAVLIWTLASIPASWGECPFFENASAAALISYLQLHPSTEQDPCIDQAFKSLNSMLPTSNLTDDQIRVLIRFLDHRRLPTAEEEKGFLVHFSPPADHYPAVGSLSKIGLRASDLLLSALSGSSTSPFRENAALAWSLIHRDDPRGGVRALANAASSQSDPGRAKNLKDAAVVVARNCPANMREGCNSELLR